MDVFMIICLLPSMVVCRFVMPAHNAKSVLSPVSPTLSCPSILQMSALNHDRVSHAQSSYGKGHMISPECGR
jgi:hypothetical protein